MRGRRQEMLQKNLWLTVRIVGTGILFASFAFLGGQAFMEPQTTQTKHLSTVKLTTTATYQPEVRPSSLFPKGGLTAPSSVIFPSITNQLVVHVETKIETSDAAITLSGVSHPTLHVIADQLWEHTFPISGSSGPFSFAADPQNTTVYSANYAIPLSPIKEFLNTVEQELQTAPNKYQIDIDPTIKGKLKYQSQTQDFSLPVALSFAVQNNEWKALNTSLPAKSSQQLTFTTLKTVPNQFQLFGFSLSMVVARITLSSLAFVFAVVFLLLVRKWNFERNEMVLTEQDQISSKYEPWFVDVLARPLTNQTLRMKSFEALFKLADGLNLPIFRYQISADEVEYLVIDNQLSYTYQPGSESSLNKPLSSSFSELLDKPRPVPGKEAVSHGG